MKHLTKLIFVIVFLAFTSTAINSEPYKESEYNKYFTPQRLRIDLVFAGDYKKQELFLQSLHAESQWSGSINNLISPFEYGEYQYKVFSKTGEEIFAKGFNTLFQEWRTTTEAKTMQRAYPSSFWIPYPKDSVNIIFYERVKNTGKYSEIGKFSIDPCDKSINREKENNFVIDTLLYGGNSITKVDLVFIAEGYKPEEMNKFRSDAKKFATYLFEIEPYKSRKKDFNIWAVESVSKESGTDIPQSGIWKNTVVSSNFYTFNIDRYLTAPDQKLIAQIASDSPADVLYVIVNTNKYGGGGIYNFYGLSMSDHSTEAAVFVHEFGHCFAGLGDEYYTSSVAYEEFYNLKVEPWEPNLTTMVDFESKWKSMMGKDGVSLYEGGGYMAKGIFRSSSDCRMKSNTAKGFCPVCIKAINNMIDYYTK